MDFALGLGIAALVVDEKVVAEGDVVALAQAAEPLRRHAFADDAVLKSHVHGIIHVHGVPAPPFNRDVIENQVAGMDDVDRAFFVLPRRDALPEPDVADHDVADPGKRDFVIPRRDAVAGRGLAGDGEVAADAQDGFERDITAHVKNDDAMAAAHGIAQRAGAGVGERGDVIKFPAASAAGELPEALRAGKGQSRRSGGPRHCHAEPKSCVAPAKHGKGQ